MSESGSRPIFIVGADNKIFITLIMKLVMCKIMNEVGPLSLHSTAKLLIGQQVVGANLLGTTYQYMYSIVHSGVLQYFTTYRTRTQHRYIVHSLELLPPQLCAISRPEEREYSCLLKHPRASNKRE